MIVKPPIYHLNRNHPLACGLVFALPIWEGAGRVHDVVNGVRQSTSESTVPTWHTREIGPAIWLPGSYYAERLTYTLLAGYTGPISATMLMRLPTGDPAGTCDFLMNTGMMHLSLYAYSSDYAIRGRRYTDGGYPTFAGTTLVPRDRWFIVTMTQDGTLNAPYVYIDGVLGSGTRTNGTGTLQTATGNVFVGTSGTDFFTGHIGLVAYHTRVLTANEISALHRDPFAIFRDPRHVSVLVPAAAAEAEVFTQYGYRWRLDDGDETGATWISPLDAHTHSAVGTATKRRLRIGVSGTGLTQAKTFKLQVRQKDVGTWEDVTVKK